jgi:hypothetical protein
MNWLNRMTPRYGRWEARIAARLHGWSIGRRWVVLVLVPCLLCCGGGVVLGGPLVWILGETVKASRGAASPVAAVDIYLGALSYGNDDGLLPVLDDSRGDMLVTQWDDYRAQMRRGGSAPSKLEYSFDGRPDTDADQAVVQAEVHPVWFGTNGHALSSAGAAHAWRFVTREDNGWQIESVTPYPWCGGYIQADACG